MWFLSYIDMNQPWIYIYSPSRFPLPLPSPPDPSGSSQWTRSEHLSHAVDRYFKNCVKFWEVIQFICKGIKIIIDQPIGPDGSRGWLSGLGSSIDICYHGKVWLTVFMMFFALPFTECPLIFFPWTVLLFPHRPFPLQVERVKRLISGLRYIPSYCRAKLSRSNLRKGAYP